MDSGLSDQMAARLIAKWEGCKLQAYLDSGGLPTIGIGTTRVDGQPVTLGMVCTEAQAHQWLLAEMAEKIRAIDAMVTVAITEGQRAALISFAYNLGTQALRTSTLLRKLNAGDVQGAADEFPKWVYCKGRIIDGLRNRRAFERGVFLGETAI